MATNRAGRPASIRTRNFKRRLSDSDAAILAAAGNGDVSAGFHNLLSIYQYLYAHGIKTIDDVVIVFDNRPE
jgi:hypothetical protein